MKMGAIMTPRRVKVEWRGEGEPLLVIHGSVVSDACLPLRVELMDDPGLEVIQYRRRGYEPTPVGTYGFDIPAAARDAAEVLEHAATGPAHVLGFSLGAHIALQLARSAPDRVRSLVLIEPALTTVPSAERTIAGLAGILSAYHAGDRSAAVDAFLTAFAGSEYRARLDERLPCDWAEKSLAEAFIYFEGELPAALGWKFDREAAADIRVPVLLVHGTETNPIFIETAERLQCWLPDARTVSIPGANHFSLTFAPQLVAQAVRAFVSEVGGGEGRGAASTPLATI